DAEVEGRLAMNRLVQPVVLRLRRQAEAERQVDYFHQDRGADKCKHDRDRRRGELYQDLTNAVAFQDRSNVGKVAPRTGLVQRRPNEHSRQDRANKPTDTVTPKRV